MIISLITMVCSLPIGILLALGRRSKMPVIRYLNTLYIEVWLGVPMITVVFMASVMLPIFMANGSKISLSGH